MTNPRRINSSFTACAFGTSTVTWFPRFANSRVDQNHVFNFRFALPDVSPIIQFCASYAGQAALAVGTYAVGWDW